MNPTKTAVTVFLAGAVLAVLTTVVAHSLWSFWLIFIFVAAFIMGADSILAPRLSRLDIRFEAPTRLFVGNRQKVEFVLSNPFRRTFPVRLKLDVSSDIEEVPDREQVMVQPGETPVPMDLRAARRGQVKVETLWILARGPLGLMEVRRQVTLNRKIPVDPDLPSVSRRAIQFFTTRNLQSGARVERHRGDGSEFDCLREYLPGFDIRTIDWKASARHAKILCKEFRAERNRQVILAVDSGRLMSEPLGELPRLDHAVSSALTLAYVSLRVGDRVGLVSFDDRLRHYLAPVKGRGAFAALSRTAAKIEYSSRETNFTLGLMELVTRQPRRALVVVMTDFVDTITSELMVENLQRTAQRHLVLFVALKDPMLTNEAERRPRNTLDLHRAVVAGRLVREGEMVVRRLRRSGVRCIDTEPRHVSASLIDHYLELKRRETF